MLLNRLGEHYEDPELAEEDAHGYRELVRDVDSAGLDAYISVKPSQLGLDIGEAAF